MDPFLFLWGPGASVVSADAPRIQPGAQGLAFWFGTLLGRPTSCRPSKAFLSPAPLLVAQLTCDKSGPDSFGPNVGFPVAPFKPPFCCFLGVFGSWPHPFRLTCDCPICLLFEDHPKGAVALGNRAKNGCASLGDFAAAAAGCSPPASAFSAKKNKNKTRRGPSFLRDHLSCLVLKGKRTSLGVPLCDQPPWPDCAWSLAPQVVW